MTQIPTLDYYPPRMVQAGAQVPGVQGSRMGGAGASTDQQKYIYGIRV